MLLRALALPRGRSLPETLLAVRFARSGGPGGQNVNKVSSKVDLRFDLPGAAPFFTPEEHARLTEKLAARLDRDGAVQITSSEHRDQAKNVEAAIARLEQLLAEALFVPKRRIATRPTRGSRERRLAEKRLTADKKAGRGGRHDD